MSKQINLQQAEKILEQTYQGKICCFRYPGYKEVWGMVDMIALSTVRGPEVVIQMNGKRFTCSPESLKDCLTLAKKANG